MLPTSDNPFPADYFKINSKNDNPKRFILFSAKYLGKQVTQNALFKIFEFIANSSSVRKNLFTVKTYIKKYQNESESYYDKYV